MTASGLSNFLGVVSVDFGSNDASEALRFCGVEGIVKGYRGVVGLLVEVVLVVVDVAVVDSSEDWEGAACSTGLPAMDSLSCSRRSLASASFLTILFISSWLRWMYSDPSCRKNPFNGFLNSFSFTSSSKWCSRSSTETDSEAWMSSKYP